MTGTSNCDNCSNFIYDYECECYSCRINLDEDEMVRFLTNTYSNCPYFQMDDDYKIVRKQM